MSCFRPFLSFLQNLVAQGRVTFLSLPLAREASVHLRDNMRQDLGPLRFVQGRCSYRLNSVLLVDRLFLSVSQTTHRQIMSNPPEPSPETASSIEFGNLNVQEQRMIKVAVFQG